jgi:hypothetical protein
LALSQKNTIPNASAVLFRRPANLDFAPELESYRFAGDWFFYATLIRTGKIAYVPDALNHYRRHEQTVTHQCIREETHTLETLSVKTRVFDTFRVPANAMAKSLGRTVLEYNQLNEQLGLNRPALTANPRLTPALNQIRTTWQGRCGSAHAMRILLVVPDMKPQTQTLANIHLANRLAEEHSVFLCNAHPGDCDPHMVEQLDDRVIRLEGTLARTPWFTEDRADLARRTRVLRELVQFHQIDLIHSRSPKADRLVHSLKDTLRVPWLIHLDDYRALFDQAGSDPESIRTATEIISSASGLFYARESDAHFFEQFTSLNRKRLFRFANGFDASTLNRLVDRSARGPDGGLRFLLIPSEQEGEREASDAIAAVRFVKSKPTVPHVFRPERERMPL